MPKCKVCDEHFKFNSDKVCWLIKTQIGENVCQNCKKQYLEKTRNKIVNNEQYNR